MHLYVNGRQVTRIEWEFAQAVGMTAALTPNNHVRLSQPGLPDKFYEVHRVDGIDFMESIPDDDWEPEPAAKIIPWPQAGA